MYKIVFQNTYWYNATPKRFIKLIPVLTLLNYHLPKKKIGMQHNCIYFFQIEFLGHCAPPTPQKNKRTHFKIFQCWCATQQSGKNWSSTLNKKSRTYFLLGWKRDVYIIKTVGIGRAQVRLSSLFSKSQSLSRLKPNLFCKFFDPTKAQAWSVKLEPDPRPQYSCPARPYIK
jgi:hypothetical protein